MGKFLELVVKDGWEFVSRRGSTAVVAILATTANDEVILVTQYRIPIGTEVLELPAGLVGDHDSTESILTAARRELLEETGFTSDEWSVADVDIASSPGLSDERLTLLRAKNCRRVSSTPTGDGDENITVHVVPLSDLPSFVRTCGYAHDWKVTSVPFYL